MTPKARVTAALAGRASGRVPVTAPRVYLSNADRMEEATDEPGWRFITSMGSPLTPGTPVSRIRRYIEMGREITSHG